MAKFICKCKHKSYIGFYNNKKCKDCNTIIHSNRPVSIGSHQWLTKRIKELEKQI